MQFKMPVCFHLRQRDRFPQATGAHLLHLCLVGLLAEISQLRFLLGGLQLSLGSAVRAWALPVVHATLQGSWEFRFLSEGHFFPSSEIIKHS